MTDQQYNRVHFLLHGSWLAVEDWKWGDPYDGGNDFDPSEHARRFPEVLSEVEDPEELHHFATNYNWDGGCDYLHQVIDSPICDRGTALLLFWLADPTHIYRGDMSPEEWQVDVHKLVRKIEAKYLSHEFQSQFIRVDPRDIFGIDYLRECEVEPGYDRIPIELKQESPGIIVEHIEI